MPNRVFPMFVGCGRSGTTLFRNIFDAHPDLAVTHEAHFVGPLASRRHRYQQTAGFDSDLFITDLLRDPNFVRQGVSEAMIREEFARTSVAGISDAIRAVFASYASRNGKTLYGDKTPGSVNFIELIGGVLPETRFVHIIRDGRAVALSYLERPEWGPQTIQEAAHHWKSRVLRGRKGGAALGSERYTEVRYEDMVESPEAVTQKLCRFLGLDYDEDMLRFHLGGESFIAATKDPDAFKNLAKPVTKGLRDWQEEMSESDLALFESIAGDLLEELGYTISSASQPVSVRLQAAFSEIAWQRKRVITYFNNRFRSRTVEGDRSI